MGLREEKNLSIFSFKKLPKAFLIAFAAIIIFELINLHFDDYFYNPIPKKGLPFEGIRVKLKNEISQSPQHSYDIVIIGDSHSHVAFMPNIIEAKTGLSCFNFSLFGRMGPLGSYLLVQNYLKTHPAKPKYLVVGFFFYNIYGTSNKQWFRKNVVTSYADFSKGNIIALTKELDLGRQRLKLLIPSIKHYDRIKYIIENPFSFRLPTSGEINNFTQQAISDKGYFPYHVNDIMQPRDPEYKLFVENSNVIGKQVNPYIRSIIDIAAENNIKIIFHISPIPSAPYKKLKSRGYIEAYHQSADSLKGNNTDFFIFDPQTSVSDHNLYVNLSHFNKNGSELMSSIFADKINELESGVK